MTMPQPVAEPQPVLHVEGLQVTYGAVRALHGLNLTLAPGERVALVGGSGSGKTSAARALAGLLPRAQWSAGQLILGGQSLRDAEERAWRSVRGRLVGMAFQDATATLDPLQRIGSAIDELLLLHRDLREAQSNSEGHETLLQARTRLLESVELHEETSLLQAYPHQLSGGQKQRVGLALALAGRPALLIADEPTSALDPRLSRAVARLLLRLSQGASDGPPPAILLISHDFRLVQAVAQRALVLEAGQVVEEGPLDEMVRAPKHQTTQILMQHAGLYEGTLPAALAKGEG